MHVPLTHCHSFMCLEKKILTAYQKCIKEVRSADSEDQTSWGRIPALPLRSCVAKEVTDSPVPQFSCLYNGDTSSLHLI